MSRVVGCGHGRRNRGVQGVHVPPTFSGRGVQEGTLCESLCVSRCAVRLPLGLLIKRTQMKTKEKH